MYLFTDPLGFFSKKVLVPGNINNAFLDNLIPDTPYSVTVSALYADGEGSPVKDKGKTCKHSKALTVGGASFEVKARPDVLEPSSKDAASRLTHCMLGFNEWKIIRQFVRFHDDFTHIWLQCHVRGPETCACTTPPPAP